MSPFKDNRLELCLFNYVHATENKFEKLVKPTEPVTKPAIESAAKSTIEFQIPIGHAKNAMKNPFSEDGSKSTMEHLDSLSQYALYLLWLVFLIILWRLECYLCLFLEMPVFGIILLQTHQ